MLRVNFDTAEVCIYETLVDEVPGIDELQYQHIMRQLRKDAAALASALTFQLKTQFLVKEG